MPQREHSTWPSRLLARVTRAVLRRRTATLIGLLALIVAAALGLTRLRIDFSSTAFYGDASEAAQRFAEHQATWGADDDTLLVLVHPEAPGDEAGVFGAERLAAIAALTDALADAPKVDAVSSITSLALPQPARFGQAELTPTSVPELAARLALAEQTPEQRRDLLERLPFVPTLLSADGRETVIVVELAFSSDDVQRTKAAVDELEAVIAAHDDALSEVGLTRELAGVPATRASFFALVVHDQLIFAPLTVTIIGLALLLVFRRIHGVVIPAVAAAVPLLVLVGIMAWTGEAVGLLNQAYFTLLPVIAVADAIHVVARYHEERRADPSPAHRDEAIVRACSRVGLACLLTSVTTAAGFASLAVADMPILRGFGLYAALGIGLAFVTVIVLVPLLLSFVRDDQLAPELPGLRPVDAVVEFAIRQPGLVLVASSAVLLLAIVPATRVEIDNTLSGLLEADHPTRVASTRVDEALGGVLGLEFELRGAEGVDLREPALLAAIHGFEVWLAQQPEVRAVEGLGTVVAGTGVLMREGSTIPPTRAGVDARLELIAPYAPLDRLVRDDGRRLRIHAGLPDAGGVAFVAFADRAEAELIGRLAGAEVEAHATGTALLAYRGVNGITRDLRDSFGLVFAVVLVVIGLSFRSLWPALVAVLPNGGPLLLGYATLGVLAQVLDPLAAVILTLALGIAVDDSLHIMVRTREELAAGARVEDAVRRAIRHSGRAVAVTSLVIVGGLGLNLGSSFPPLQLLGVLGSVVIGLALVMDLLVLPALIVVAGGRGLGAH
ncbi:Membrane protein YdfJ [Enhygromyxa salina]|uniref:Membrane protein YdfJ n=1 Tax=Enhygromyxa salina TaxID=215803 RepID=A0A2S9XUZ4_9BACT|nr:MMPL family transporter [Enhygromyxa salina]PRP96531.1 Membrane protein YdfJ [Enhygromyxa salina]